MAASLTLNNLLRYQGSAFYGMIGMLSGAVLNIVLDPIFIFTLDMGVSGASLATMLSQMVGFCLLLAGTRRSGNIPVSLRSLSLRAADLRQIFLIGLPSLCRQGLASVAAIMLNRMAGQFGDAAIAAMSVVQRVSMFAMSALLGWGQGFQPVCGFNYGARRFDRVKTAFWFCVKVSTCVLVLMSAAGMIFAPEIIALFRRDDPEVIRIGTLAMRFQAALFPTMGWFVLNNMLLQSIGHSGRASLLALARQGLFLMPILLLLTPELGLLAIQMAQPLADVGTVALSLYLGLGVLRRMPSTNESGRHLAGSECAGAARRSVRIRKPRQGDLWENIAGIVFTSPSSSCSALRWTGSLCFGNGRCCRTGSRTLLRPAKSACMPAPSPPPSACSGCSN
jgi:Na+-driven multidrug efflux pump